MAIGNSRPPVALIAGPTASGKSALALGLAEGAGGVVINADSAQVYRDLPVLSAAPGKEDRDRAEHRLYGALDGSKACSAADWAAMARQEIADVHANGRLPILAGGTGLYLRTLLDGIAPVPAIDPKVRKQVRSATAAENYARLSQLDQAAASRLNAGDTTRIARALEVIVSTGRPLAEWQSAREGGISDTIALQPLILLPPRDWLYERCDTRFEAMLQKGAIEEVERLLSRDLDPALPVMRAIGVPEISAYLRGQMSREEMTAAAKQATRRYAKRQYTWLAHQPPPQWPRFSKPLDGQTIDEALAQLQASS